MTFVSTNLLSFFLISGISSFALFLLLFLLQSNQISFKLRMIVFFISIVSFGIVSSGFDALEDNCQLEKTYYEELITIAHSPNPTQIEISHYNNLLHELQKFQTQHPECLSGEYNWKEQPDL